MKKILSSALMISMLAIASCSSNNEDDSVVPIPDPAFKAHLLERFDSNKNGEISFSEAKNATFIKLTDASIYSAITSFQGIEYFTEITQLDLGNCNNVTSLDVSKNTRLWSIHFCGTQISSIDLSKNVNLTDLGCSENKLTSIDLSNNVNLVKFSCIFNKITELDLSKNVLLKELNCGFNKMTVLDLYLNVNLTSVYCPMDTLITIIVKQGQIIDIGKSPSTQIVYVP